MKLSHRPKELIAVSPEATVPVLVEPDGTVIEESIDIMRRALERNAPEGWLEREDRALIEANSQIAGMAMPPSSVRAVPYDHGSPRPMAARGCSDLLSYMMARLFR